LTVQKVQISVFEDFNHAKVSNLKTTECIFLQNNAKTPNQSVFFYLV